MAAPAFWTKGLASQAIAPGAAQSVALNMAPNSIPRIVVMERPSLSPEAEI